MKNTTRNRWAGYFGVAVATLLTPAGKLISSAVAAGAAVALIAMSDGPRIIDAVEPPVPALATSSALIEEYFANEMATSELTSSEPGIELFATKENRAGLMLTPMPSTAILASSLANGPGGGSLFDSPTSFGPALGADPIYREPREPGDRVDCEQVYKKDDSEKTELEKALCDSVVTDNEELKKEIVELITEVTPETGDSKGGNPPLVVVNDSPQNPADGLKPPTDEDQIPPGNNTGGSPLVLPSEPVFRLSNDVPVTIAAIPEPSTLGLLLLGLFSLGWVYRRNTKV